MSLSKAVHGKHLYIINCLKMINRDSERHHYLPEFFLKEFTNNAGFLFVYDKEKKLILPKKKSPKSIFFEWKRNTTRLGDKEFVWIEEIYKRMDSDFSQNYKKILEFNYSQLSEKEEISKILDILMVVNFIRWRVPARDSITQNIYEKYKIGDLSMKITNKSGDLVKNLEFEEFIKSQDVFKKGQSSMLIFEPWYHFEKLKNTCENVKLFTQDNYDTLICDNPYIEEIISDDVQSFSEFLFPLSKKHLAIYVEDFNNKPLDSTFCYLFELAKFHQAQKYVASSNREILEFYSHEYEKWNDENITKWLFKYIKNK